MNRVSDTDIESAVSLSRSLKANGWKIRAPKNLWLIATKSGKKKLRLDYISK